MKRICLPVAVLAVAAYCCDAMAIDTIRRIGAASVSGTVKSVSATEVVITRPTGDERVPTSQIESIQFDPEPNGIRNVRNVIRNGGYATALTELAKIDPKDLNRKELQQDAQYYKALATARLALGGAADAQEAGRLLFDFVSKNQDSYHFLPANEVLGDLFVSLQQYDKYRPHYDMLANSPFPEFKMRAGVATGRALMSEGKFAEALQAFAGVVGQQGGTGNQVKSLQFAATLGKAECMAQTGQVDEALKLVTDVIANLDAEDAQLQAQAYVTHGNCLRKKPGAEKEALLAFLHVHVLYSSNPAAHAEALANMVELWRAVGKEERAAQANSELRSRYANSPWAKRSG